MGRTPDSLDENPLLFADWITTPLDDMISVCDALRLHLLEFVDRKASKIELSGLERRAKGSFGIGRTSADSQIKAELSAFFGGTSADFTTPLAFDRSPFARSDWDVLRRIPAGVARVVPCHRAIGADGSLTGYGGALWRKQRFLKIERNYKLFADESARP